EGAELAPAGVEVGGALGLAPGPDGDAEGGDDEQREEEDDQRAVLARLVRGEGDVGDRGGHAPPSIRASMASACASSFAAPCRQSYHATTRAVANCRSPTTRGTWMLPKGSVPTRTCGKLDSRPYSRYQAMTATVRGKAKEGCVRRSSANAAPCCTSVCS